jgi:predicted ABC-type ATPase
MNCKDAGYLVELWFVGLVSPELNIMRVAERVKRGGHSIDENVIRRRFTGSVENLGEASRIADRVVLRDNSGVRPITYAFKDSVSVDDQKFSLVPGNEPIPQWIWQFVQTFNEKLR